MNRTDVIERVASVVLELYPDTAPGDALGLAEQLVDLVPWLTDAAAGATEHDSWLGAVERAITEADPIDVPRACPGCGAALEYAGDFDGRLPSSGVSWGHEGFGATYRCENGHWFTLLMGRLVGPDRILTVVEREPS